MSANLHANHPLFLELRTGLWHCTGPAEYRLIRKKGFITPHDGRVNRWGGPSCCQELGAVSLFDFETSPVGEVFSMHDKWRYFIGRYAPVTIIVGIDRALTPGRLIPYPDNRDQTTQGNVIPVVEVCHCGPIPLTAVTKYLLVCAGDYSRFHKIEGKLTYKRLAAAHREFFALAVQAEAESQARLKLAEASRTPAEIRARQELYKAAAAALKRRRERES